MMLLRFALHSIVAGTAITLVACALGAFKAPISMPFGVVGNARGSGGNWAIQIRSSPLIERTTAEFGVTVGSQGFPPTPSIADHLTLPPVAPGNYVDLAWVRVGWPFRAFETVGVRASPTELTTASAPGNSRPSDLAWSAGFAVAAHHSDPINDIVIPLRPIAGGLAIDILVFSAVGAGLLLLRERLRRSRLVTPGGLLSHPSATLSSRSARVVHGLIWPSTLLSLLGLLLGAGAEYRTDFQIVALAGAVTAAVAAVAGALMLRRHVGIVWTWIPVVVGSFAGIAGSRYLVQAVVSRHFLN